MGAFSTILSFLRAVPTLVSLLKQVWGSLADFYNAYNRRKQAERLRDALKVARETKNTAAIEQFFNPDLPVDPVPDGDFKLPDDGKPS